MHFGLRNNSLAGCVWPELGHLVWVAGPLAGCATRAEKVGSSRDMGYRRPYRRLPGGVCCWASGGDEGELRGFFPLCQQRG